MEHIVTVLVYGLLLGGVYGLVSIGLNLIFGVVRIVNFAQGELVMFGMYGTYVAHAHFGINPYMSVLVVAPQQRFFSLTAFRAATSQRRFDRRSCLNSQQS